MSEASRCSWIHFIASSSVVRDSIGTSKVSKCGVLSPRLNRKTRNRRVSVASAAPAAGWSIAVCTALTSCGGEVGGVGEQDGLAGPALGLDAELAADHVGAELGHAAERRALAARDRYEA